MEDKNQVLKEYNAILKVNNSLLIEKIESLEVRSFTKPPDKVSSVATARSAAVRNRNQGQLGIQKRKV